MKNVFYQTETARGSASPQAAAPRRLRMKRFIALAAAILCGMNWAWAYSFSVEYYGKTLYFNIREGSYVEVTFPGNSTISPWPDGITKPTGTVTIPSTVTNPNTGTTYPVKQIGSSAFAGCTGIYQVSLPVSNLSFIGADAFYGCTGLYSIGFPSVVTEIELRAFQGCTGLTSVTIPSTVQTIGNWAFEDCTNLTSVSIYSNAVASTDYGYTYISPTNTKYDNFRSRFGNQVTSYTLGSQVTAIGKNAFYGCTGMTEIDFLGHVNSIGSRAFSGCTNLTSVDISHLTTINSDTFSGCLSLTSVTIPSSVTSIGYSAFSGCTGLTSVTIPSSVTTIDTYAFSGCTGFSSVTIPSTVQTVGNWAFANCPNLTTVTINSNAVASKNYSVTDFNGTISYSNFRSIFGNQVTCYILGSQVTGIGQRAFYDCTNIQTLYVNSTTPPTIDYLAFYNVPTNTPVHVPCGSRDAYENTTSWNSRFSNFVEECPINFADSWVKARCVVYWDINGDGELSYNEAAAVTNLGMVFYANPMESFEELQYFTGIESIPISAFMNCTSLTKIKIPNTVTSIEQSAFRHCTALASIIIPNSVTTIGVWAFENCTGLQSITVLATEPPILGVNSSYATYAFNNVPTNTPVYVPCSSRDAYVAAEGWKEFTNIGGNCHIVFADWQVEEVCADEWGYQGTLSYNDAAAVTSLNGLFTNNNRIHTFDELQYFTGLTYLGEEEFFDCNQLTSITLPEGLTTIYSFAFQYSGLESIFIPANVTEIGTSVFAACNNLETIEVDPNNTTYTSNNGCNIIVNKGTMSVVAGCANSNFYEGILEIEEFAFDGETSLTTIVLPSTLEAIKSGAFYSCTNLTSIRVNATTPPTVGYDAFYGVDKNNCQLIVPCGSRDAYQNATGWSTFTNIQEDCETITLSITGYGNNPTTTEGWHLIASPLWEPINATDVGNLLSNEYDLYKFDGSKEGQEWRNYKNNENNGFHAMYFATGYLYANSKDVELQFVGSTIPSDSENYNRNLYSSDTKFGNWNLVGNSFTTEATVSVTDYYRIEPGTRNLMLSSGNVNPMEGIFVEYNSTLDEVEFTKLTRGERAIESPMVNIDLRNAEGHLLDRARLRTGEGAQLSKLDMLSDPNRLYFRIDGKDYAVARVNGQGEMPLHFDAAQNGTYSLNVNVEGMEMAYLHLIDNMTGEDVDLLATSTGSVAKYTFTGKPSDYASRFRLVFETGSSAEGDSFAFIDAAGNIVINGEGTLQIVDVMGRVVVSVGGHTRCVPTTGIPAGVYVLRLINGNDVMTQKIVVE